MMIEKIELRVAHPVEKELLKKLFQFYLHDLSEYSRNLEVNSEGYFENDDVEHFYNLDNAIPMTICMNKRVIGFVFLMKGRTVDYVVHDLFILRSHRKKGIAKLVIKQIFNKYRGKYGLIILQKNEPSLLFWRSVLKEHMVIYEEIIETCDEEKCVKLLFSI